MTSPLTSIPSELFQEITSLLLRPDEAALARTCKALNRLLTPVIWGDIELHHSGTHEGMNVENEVDDFQIGQWESVEARLADAEVEDSIYPFKKLIYEPSSRKYSQCGFNLERWSASFKEKGLHWQTPDLSSTRATDNANRRNFQHGREEKFVGAMKIASKERWAELAQHVRSLCMSIGVDDEVVEVIASFRNLRSLELIGLPLARAHPATARQVNLPNLQNLKLRGYFPAALARNICHNAEHVTHLDIGLLATPTDDAAYKNTLLLKMDDDSEEPVSEEPVTEGEAEEFRRNGAEAASRSLKAEGAKSESPDADGEEGEEDSDDESDEEDLPWALHSPIWLPRSLAQAFSGVTQLHLVKPATGETGSMMSFDNFTHIPHRYEQVLCMEWVFLLEAVAGSLKELVLEHRIPMEDGDTVGDGDPLPEFRGSQSLSGWRSAEADRGDELFCRSVLRFMLEHGGRFSSLRRLALRGIQMSGLKTDKDSDQIPGSNGVPDNNEALRRAFPNCEIDIFEETYPIHVYAGYVYQSWPGNRHEAMQDEGDGLLYNSSYYNDYKKRFGPQWRIMD
ncbi:hypothetical protein SLS64_011022 [Diaporthe eres]|uniref:F-box domain-containing protein n=1 Tax=Diaporthe eres TaxID=83184 RepID=A0ABR1P1H4_DIAER